MNYEEKIKELTERIEVLEKAEHKRIVKKRIETITRIVGILIIIVLIYLGYNYVNTNYIKPYKERLDYVNEKVDTVESFINDKLGGLQKYFK